MDLRETQVSQCPRAIRAGLPRGLPVLAVFDADSPVSGSRPALAARQSRPATAVTEPRGGRADNDLLGPTRCLCVSLHPGRMSCCGRIWRLAAFGIFIAGAGFSALALILPVSTAVVIAGRYRLDRQLAGDQAGEVWQRAGLELARPVAVKLLHAGAGDADAVTQFRAAARRAGALAAARQSSPGSAARLTGFAGIEGDLRGAETKPRVREDHSADLSRKPERSLAGSASAASTVA